MTVTNITYTITTNPIVIIIIIIIIIITIFFNNSLDIVKNVITVKNITSYGVFIDLGGVDGLIHITDLSWSRVNHPSEILEDGQTVKVVILDFDDEKTRIQLGMKQLEAHPWDALSADLKVGDKVNSSRDSNLKLPIDKSRSILFVKRIRVFSRCCVKIGIKY